MSPFPPRITALFGALSAVALMTSCSVTAPAPGPEPTAAPTTETLEPEPTSRQWPLIAVVDPSGIKNLETFAINDNDRQVHVVVPQLRGHDEFDSVMTGWANTLAQEFVDDYYAGAEGDTAADGEGADRVARPSLSGTWSTTAASKEILGFYLESSASPGASVGLDRETLWYNPRKGKFVRWQDLLTTKGSAELPAAVRKSLDDAQLGYFSEDLADAFNRKPAIGFTPGGDLFVGFDAYEIAAGSEGAPAVVFPDAVDSGWLSKTGLRAREATLNPNPALVPQEPVIPEKPAVDCSVEKCIALTFDDGPSGVNTPRLLDILKREQVPATFFVLGSQARAFPGVLTRAVSEGHEIANHSWSHPSLPALGRAGVDEQVRNTNDTVYEITGVRPKLLRPPYGATSDTVAASAKAQGLVQAMWNIDTLDWQHHSPKKTIAAASRAGRGSIVLMHDIHSSTVDAVPGVIRSLRERGFTFVTVSSLVDGARPGQVVYQGN